MSSVPKEVGNSVLDSKSQTPPPTSIDVSSNTPNKHSNEKTSGDQVDKNDTIASLSGSAVIAEKPPPPAEKPPTSVIIPFTHQPSQGVAASDDASVRPGLSFLSTGELFL